jgi:electron transport complex protein RnfC
VATLAQIGELLPQRQGLIERVMTVSGPGVTRPGNYLVALGTPIRWILEQAGCTDQATSVILGGPMMGASIGSFDVPVTKGVTGILVLTNRESDTRVFPCIHCASCVTICPMHLNPSQLGMLARKERYEEMAAEYHLNDCFECGCCSYVCPSHIPLVQYFRVAKQTLRKAKALA